MMVCAAICSEVLDESNVNEEESSNPRATLPKVSLFPRVRCGCAADLLAGLECVSEQAT